MQAESSRMAQERANLANLANQEDFIFERQESPELENSTCPPRKATKSEASLSRSCYAGDSTHTDARTLKKLGVWIGDCDSHDRVHTRFSYNQIIDACDFDRLYNDQDPNSPWMTSIHSKPAVKDMKCHGCATTKGAYDDESLIVRRVKIPRQKDRAFCQFPCELDGRRVFAIVANQRGTGIWRFWMAQGGYLNPNYAALSTISDNADTTSVDDLEYRQSADIPETYSTSRKRRSEFAAGEDITVGDPSSEQSHTVPRHESRSEQQSYIESEHRPKRQRYVQPTVADVDDDGFEVPIAKASRILRATDLSTARSYARSSGTTPPREVRTVTPDAIPARAPLPTRAHPAPLVAPEQTPFIEPRPATGFGRRLGVLLHHAGLGKKFRLSVDPNESLSKTLAKLRKILSCRIPPDFEFERLEVSWGDVEESIVLAGDTGEWSYLMETLGDQRVQTVEVLAVTS